MEEGNLVSRKRKSQSPNQAPRPIVKIEDDLDLLMPIEGLSKNFAQESEYIKKEKERLESDNSSPPQVKRGKQEVPQNDLPRLIPFNIPKPEPIDLSDDVVTVVEQKPQVPSPTQLYSKINAEHRQVICLLDNKQKLLVNIQNIIARKSRSRNQEVLNYQRQGQMLIQEIQQLMNRKFLLSNELARLASIVTSADSIEIVEEIKVKDEKKPIVEETESDVINLVEDENEQVNPSVRVEQEQTKKEKNKETHVQAYRDNLTRDYDAMPDMEPSEFLTTKLMAHQTQGLHWMYTRETDPLNRCKGGILADDMGLGKTIQTIALMLANPGPADSAGTLIICPLSTLDQWEEEIINKVSPRANISILKYYGSGRTDDPDELATYDVVLTTYGTMSNEYSETQPKTLASVDWFRIVLDEAHAIKNCNSRTAKAACKLNALHRWCLSGTPIQNGLWELFSLLNFIQCEGLQGRTWFRKNVVKAVQNGDVSGYNQLRIFLNAVVLRRTKHQTIRGNRLLTLPDLITEVRKIQLSADEQLFYKSLEEQASTMYETFKRSGTIRNNFMHIFELLLRLRQCCDHSFLVMLCLLQKRKGRHYSEASQIYKEVLVSLKSGDRELANAVVQKLFNTTGNATCAICMDEMNDAHATTCGHMFCKDCIEDWMDRNTNPLCPICRKNILNIFPRRTAEDQVANFEAERAKAAKLLEEQESQENGRQPTEFDTFSGPNNTMVSLKNSKLEAFADEITKFPGRKTLVFCQFTMFMDMLEVILTNLKIHYVRLDGSMSKEDRKISTDEFDKNPNCTVYLISLKAGGTGLNLTSATQVFIMDPWWNPAVESQAVDRAYRFGQYYDVRVVHFITQDAIEAKIQELQEQKKAVTEQALNGTGTADGLRIRDLNVLFSRNAFMHIGQNNNASQANHGH